jgi:hypothetical protein
MAKKLALANSEGALALAVLAWVANWFAVKWWNYPFLYCSFKGVAWGIYQPFAELAYTVALVYLLWSAFRMNGMGIVSGLVLMVLALNLPEYAAIVFKLGGSCDG